MRKIWVAVVLISCVIWLAGCQKTIPGADVYAFPEPTTQINGFFYSQGAEYMFSVGSEEYLANDMSVIPVMEWFYGLEMTACEVPENVEGGESYTFYVNGEYAFSYQDRGNEGYIIISDTWYKVKHPSAPPVAVTVKRK